jgi:hypothetical protein
VGVEARPTFIGPAALAQQRVALHLGVSLMITLILIPLTLRDRAVGLVSLVDVLVAALDFPAVPVVHNSATGIGRQALVGILGCMVLVLC